MNEDSAYVGRNIPETARQSIPDHPGDSYITVLERIHVFLSPGSYLEIGTQSGQSLSIARCPSIAIDPSFQVSTNVFTGKNVCHFYQIGSDEFFKMYDPTLILSRRLDLVFLDGMHWFEFLLRDFMNSELHCNPNSIIAIHDCLPLDLFSARRDIHDMTAQETSSHPGWWTGDVWKVVVILQRYRPELKITALDASPTGLILITGLDPGNTVLQDNYFKILDEFSSVDLSGVGIGNYFDSLEVKSTTSLATRSQMSALFWL